MSWIFLLYFAIVATDAATHTDLERLYENLTSNYNKHILPNANLSQPIIVNVGFELMSVQDLDEKSSRLTTVGTFFLEWNDFQMTWNRDSYGNLDSIVLPQNTVWKPELVLLNPYDKVQPLGFDRQTIRVGYDGAMHWSPSDVFNTRCSVDVTLYPFDTTTCIMVFSVWGYRLSEVSLLKSVFGKSYFSENGLWKLEEFNIELKTSPYSQTLFFHLKIQRRSTFQALSTLGPTTIMGILHLMVFLLPAGCGERVGFSVTVLLAVAVFMSIVMDSLPSTSEPSVPVVCYLLAADLVINTVITICTILGLRLHHKPEMGPAPRWMYILVCRRPCKKRRVECGLDRNLDSGADNNDQTYGIEYVRTAWSDSKTNDQLNKNEGKRANENKNAVHEESQDDDYYTWGELAGTVDGILFVFLILATVVRQIAGLVILM